MSRKDITANREKLRYMEACRQRMRRFRRKHSCKSIEADIPPILSAAEYTKAVRDFIK